MKCNEIQDKLLDLTAANNIPSPEVSAHVRSCTACNSQLLALQQTMALLDEWQAPEPSQYFNARLHARLRLEETRVSWTEKLRAAFSLSSRKLVLAGSLAAAIVAGVLVSENSRPEQPPANQTAQVQAQTGTPVADLETLDTNEDLYANFDLLDDMSGATVVPASVQVSQ